MYKSVGNMPGNLDNRVASVVEIIQIGMEGFHTYLARSLKKIISPWTGLNKKRVVL